MSNLSRTQTSDISAGADVMARNLVARSDACGRVWIEDAEHGRFPPAGLYLQFPQHEAKRDVEAMLATARKMAAAEDLAAALKASTRMLSEDRDNLVDSASVPSGYISDEYSREAVAEYDALITANNAAIDKAEKEA